MKKFSFLFALVGAMFASAAFAQPLADAFSVSAESTVLAIFGLSLTASFAAPVTSGVAMSLTYSPSEFKGEAYPEIFMEVLYQNDTLGKEYARLMPNVKTETILTELTATATGQAYKSSPVSGDAAGTLTIKDYIERPVALMMYDEYSPYTFKYSRFGAKAKPG
jgi:hypothetical protein